MLTVEDPVSSLSSGDLSAKDSGQSLTSPACAFPALLYIRAWKSHGFTMFALVFLLDLGVIQSTAPGFKIINTQYKYYFWFGRFLNNNPGYIQDIASRCSPRPNSWRSTGLAPDLLTKNKHPYGGQSCWEGEASQLDDVAATVVPHNKQTPKQQAISAKPRPLNCTWASQSDTS